MSEANSTFTGTKRRLSPRNCMCERHLPAPAGINRRQLLAAGGAAGLLATGLAPAALAQDTPRCIDVHCHIVAPAWLDAMDIIGRKDAVLANWSVQKMLDDMDRAGVATAITSPTTPQVAPLGRDTAARLARESNEYAKKLETDHPGRFGTFAMLPLPHIDDSLKEIAYAFDTLKVDGVSIMTSYRDKWLGYPEFAPLWEELNRRKATVYTHPTAANCCVNLVSGVIDASIEFGTDTVRSIASVIFSGTSRKYPDINWIWSHGGGGLTAYAERFEISMLRLPPYQGKITLETVDGELNRFYYDTAQIANGVTLDALSKLVPVSQIVFGSDFPYRSAVEHAKGVAAHFQGEDLKKVERGNALRLMPRLGSA